MRLPLLSLAAEVTLHPLSYWRMQEREKRQRLAFRISSKRVSPAKVRLFCIVGGFVCADGWSGKEELVSMHGGCKEKTRGQTGGEGRLNVKAESVKPKRKSKNSYVFLKY